MMHPVLLQLVKAERARDLQREARRARLVATARANPGVGKPVEITIRDAQPQDFAAVERLAALDGRPAPGGRVVLASVGGAVRAAIGMDGGVVADPFVPTTDLVALLRVRADQLARGDVAGTGGTPHPVAGGMSPVSFR